MSSELSDLATRLARDAEAVCQRYLSNGRREGSYWLVGDVRNAPGRSLFVRLKGPLQGKGAAGKWCDGATSEHGDLLDVIRESCGLRDVREAAEEARRFLAMPPQEPTANAAQRANCAPTGSPESARRLFAMSRPLSGTLAETYLRNRGITALHDATSLRFHPRCYYRASGDAEPETWPAMTAAVTDLAGAITGAHRTWLAPNGFGKAPVDTPRRAMGRLLGSGVRFGVARDVMAAGEGVETMLSLRSVLPSLTMVAALSAGNLAALQLPQHLRRLYVARDNDAAGAAATDALIERARQMGVEAILLTPRLGDFNDDLRLLGADELRADVRLQLVPEDVARFLAPFDKSGKGR
jgi:phage/plasmid primase-like uncharacterized protein